MPYVKFLRDYQGTTTSNVFYKAGTVVDLPGRMSYALRSEGVVVKVAPVKTRAAAVPNPAAVLAVPHKSAPKLGTGTKAAAKRASKKATKH